MTPRRRPVLLGAAAAALGGAASAIEGSELPCVAAAIVAGAALGAARRHPRAAWIVLVGALAALVAAPSRDMTLGLGALIVAHTFCTGRWEERWAGVAGLASVVGVLEVGVALTDGAPVPALLLPAATWSAGRALRERELVAIQLAERARELEEEREAHAALSVRYERARIASELHDIVAHAISVMVVQASAGQRLAASDPELTVEAFEAIAAAAREAEQDMTRLVALLGDEDAIGPAPDLAVVEELVARAAGSGLGVTLRLEGEREGLPTPVVEAAYRIVQEGLTNALRYAAGAPVLVTVRGDSDALVVEVSNPAAGRETALVDAGTGTGLQGLRERAAACGGTLTAGPTADGGWQVRARLPRRAAAPADQGALTRSGDTRR